MDNNFQKRANDYGTTGELLALKALRRAGFAGITRQCHIIGGTVDFVARAKSGRKVAFEVKWARRGTESGDRPGMRRTCTINKAIAEAWKSSKTSDMPFVILTSHMTMSGDGLDSINLALNEGLVRAVLLTRDAQGLRALYESL